MGITRSQKEVVVSALNKDIEDAGAVVFADFSGINVDDLTELRVKMREADVSFRVVKNTLLKRALEGAGVDPEESVYELLSGPTAIAYGTDEVQPAKVIKEFSKSHGGLLQMKGGFIAGRSYTASEVVSLADMPGREELLARVVGSMNAPIQGFVMVTSGVIRKFLYAVNAIIESKE